MRVLSMGLDAWGDERMALALSEAEQEDLRNHLESAYQDHLQEARADEERGNEESARYWRERASAALEFLRVL